MWMSFSCTWVKYFLKKNFTEVLQQPSLMYTWCECKFLLHGFLPKIFGFQSGSSGMHANTIAHIEYVSLEI